MYAGECQWISTAPLLQPRDGCAGVQGEEQRAEAVRLFACAADEGHCNAQVTCDGARGVVASRVRQFRLACAYEEGDGVASSRECGGGSFCTKDLLLNQVKKQRPSGTSHSDLLVDFRCIC